MRIKELREEKNITQIELAKAINTTQSNIGRWEKGLNDPSYYQVVKLADFFNTSIDYLVGRTDEIEVRSSEGHSLTKNESELLKLFNLLDEVKQNKVIGYCYALAN